MSFTYLSYGAGVQSTALLVMSALQLEHYPCPKADVAVFADTGDEPAWVYETLRYYRQHVKGRIPVITVKKSVKLSESIVAAATTGVASRSIPAYEPNFGFCTLR